MAKRFTDTNKYRKRFFRSLTGAYKLLWDFLYHDCDHAGIWTVDFEIAQKYVGEDMLIDQRAAFYLFNEDEIRVIEFDKGKKWFIPSFITFQYGKLSEKNRAHNNVIEILRKFSLIDDNLSPITELLKPLWQYPKGDKDMDKEKEMEQEEEKEIKKEKEIPRISMPFNGNFLEAWAEWKKYKLKQHDFKYKSDGTEQAALHSLTTLSTDEETCIAIIHQSMANGWKGFFPLKNNIQNGSSKISNAGFSREGVQAELVKRIESRK